VPQNYVREIIANGLISSPVIPRPARHLLLRLAGKQTEHCAIESHVTWFGSGPVSVGRGAFINRGVTINHSAAVTIGANVALGPGVTILTATHKVGPSSKRAGDGYSRPVAIGDGAWLGANVTVMPGVSIGKGAVIGAGAVVTADCDPDTIYAGVPAKAFRVLSDVQREADAVVRSPQ